MKSDSNTKHARQDATQFILLLIAVVSLLCGDIPCGEMRLKLATARVKNDCL